MRSEERSMWLVGLVLMLCSSCSRQPAVLPPQENAQSLPFNDSAHSDGISPTQAFASNTIPAGTVVVIRLQSPLSSAESHAGDEFRAVLEEPIVVQSQTLAPGGIEVTGKVLAAKGSGPREPGYLRLTLSSLILDGKAVDIHTSSVFSKGNSQRQSRPLSSSGLLHDPERTTDIQFSTGRRLTFRLIQSFSPRG